VSGSGLADAGKNYYCTTVNIGNFVESRFEALPRMSKSEESFWSQWVPLLGCPVPVLNSRTYLYRVPSVQIPGAPRYFWGFVTLATVFSWVPIGEEFKSAHNRESGVSTTNSLRSRPHPRRGLHRRYSKPCEDEGLVFGVTPGLKDASGVEDAPHSGNDLGVCGVCVRERCVCAPDVPVPEPTQPLRLSRNRTPIESSRAPDGLERGLTSVSSETADTGGAWCVKRFQSSPCSDLAPPPPHTHTHTQSSLNFQGEISSANGHQSLR
jgi:hypothetical protein